MNTARENVPDKRFLLSHPWHFISLGFGSGLSPVMPGTTGTLFAWITYDLLTWLAPAFSIRSHGASFALPVFFWESGVARSPESP